MEIQHGGGDTFGGTLLGFCGRARTSAELRRMRRGQNRIFEGRAVRNAQQRLVCLEVRFDIPEILQVRPADNWLAEDRWFEHIVPASFCQRAAHEDDRRVRKRGTEFPNRIKQQNVGSRVRETGAAGEAEPFGFDFSCHTIKAFGFAGRQDQPPPREVLLGRENGVFFFIPLVVCRGTGRDPDRRVGPGRQKPQDGGIWDQSTRLEVVLQVAR